ncbi:MAG TPA: phosphoribosylglycinamide formyltransferase [Candidatus Omnitrophota bacterium]|nr:phosphoribosylglycinamide formyltransferase [Candidatus Omnitrophota bacterium]
MNFAVFASGHGSNLQAIIHSVQKGEIKASLSLVFSNNPQAFALERANRSGIKTLILNPNDYINRQSFDREIMVHLKEEKIDFVVLAGYMLLLSPFFIKKFPYKILNVHPSLLPAFKGTRAIKDAFLYGVKTTGVTIHFVDEKMDHGQIIMQEAVRIKETDTLEILEQRIHSIEHRLYPKVIDLFAEGKLKVEGRKVILQT